MPKLLGLSVRLTPKPGYGSPSLASKTALVITVLVSIKRLPILNSILIAISPIVPFNATAQGEIINSAPSNPSSKTKEGTDLKVNEAALASGLAPKTKVRTVQAEVTAILR